jgi:hypothetical protein
MIRNAAQTLQRSAEVMRTYLDYFDQEQQHLAESLHNATRSYLLGDESAAEAIDNETSVSAVVVGGPVVDDSHPAMLGAASPGLSDGPPHARRVQGPRTNGEGTRRT